MKVSDLFINRTYTVDEVFVHPEYKPELIGSPHDIALLKLSQRPKLIRNEIFPICLPESAKFVDDNSNQNAWVIFFQMTAHYCIFTASEKIEKVKKVNKGSIRNNELDYLQQR